ncbi:hypothetical protein BGZ76_000443 [Entomortierella beljakovae]|nr:hypothetical protein BGZ76_000443 [Entomortierella beljakovae]
MTLQPGAMSETELLHPQLIPTSGSNVVVFDQTIDVDEDVADFFDSRFLSRQDLVKIKTTLQEQSNVGGNLGRKLEESKERTSQILKEAYNTSTSSLGRLKNLESSAADLEEQIEESEAFGSGKSSGNQQSLIEELTALQSRVRALEDAKRYIYIVSRTQELISESKTLLESSSEKALIPYNKLVQLSNNVKKTLEGNNTKLERYVSSCTGGLLQELKSHISKKFQSSLDAVGWPKPISDPSSISKSQRDSFELTFKELLLLQEPTYGPIDRSGDKPFQPLLTTELMIAPLPEWYLTHILELIKEHTPFLQDFVQDILQETEYREYDAKNDFIRLLLGAVEKKIKASVPAMLPSPEMLSHAIYETLRFDKSLRENEFYMPPGQTKDWEGAVQVYLGNREWLKAWLRVEKESAVARYNQIMDDTDAWLPAYEDVSDKTLIVPTKSAEKLLDHLDSITDRYRPLPVVEHKSFMLDIQLNLLLSYHRHIRNLVDEYEAMTYSFGRVIPGPASIEERNTEGIDGLRNLCQWMSSVEYIVSTLKDWGEDVLFLELFNEISQRTQRIPNPLHSDNEDSDNEEMTKRFDGEGTIFDEPVKAFGLLSKRIQELVVKNITKDVFGSMKPYVSLRSWPQIEFSVPDSNGHSLQTPVDSLENDDISPELYHPLTILTHSFEFLSGALCTKHFTLLYKQVSSEIQDFFWQKIIMKNSFSELGGLQLARDFRIGVLGASRRWIKKGENYHRKLRDASILLSLQSAKANSPAPPQMLTFDQDVKKVDTDTGSKYVKKTLAQMMAVLFDDELNADTAKSKLEEIGVMSLSVVEAKSVIRRRVECWR